ncbi:MAG TPA: type II toxin-antitoxin system VapC family toxin [Nitrospiria bacterium]|nr:type II toxin-antitoxin system VapC family toxin [Nitrospiria bacterium]
MPSIFIDTSSLVKFYYPEVDSNKVESLLLESDLIYISYLTVVEMASALQKKVRIGDLKKHMCTVIWNTFMDDLDAEKIELIPIADRYYFKAADLIKEYGGRYGIKTLDSLQLSVASSLHDPMFLCSDKRLNKVASLIGINLVHL